MEKKYLVVIGVESEIELNDPAMEIARALDYWNSQKRDSFLSSYDFYEEGDN